MNAKDYGIPQNRQRVFTISIRKDIHQQFYFPAPIKLSLRLKDMLEDNVSQSFYLNQKQTDGFLNSTYNERRRTLQKADGISSTLEARQWRDPLKIDEKEIKPQTLQIREATKKGYAEANEGDFVNLQYPTSETRRARVWKAIAMSILATEENGVVVQDYLSDKGVKFVLDPKRGMLTDINADISQTVTAKGQQNWTGSFVSPDIQSIEKSTTIGSKEPVKIHLMNGQTITSDDDTSQLRIRKLTPKECWRLMGFDDEAYEKAEKVCSKTQLYKQAGNSIVVNVLEAILTELLVNKQPLEQEQMSIFDFIE